MSNGMQLSTSQLLQLSTALQNTASEDRTGPSEQRDPIVIILWKLISQDPKWIEVLLGKQDAVRLRGIKRMYLQIQNQL